MPLWGRNDTANNAPRFNSVEAGTNANGQVLFGNVSVSAFSSTKGKAVGVFAVDSAEAKATKRVVHPGWVKVTQGTGPVRQLSVSTGGSGYSNSDLVRVSGGTVNASAAVTTNSTGGITGVTISVPGAGFINSASTTSAVTNSTGGSSSGTGATLTVTLGGRAGRVHMETLVALGTIQGDANDDSTLPDA